jgi:predicted nucleic acid-binding protein
LPRSLTRRSSSASSRSGRSARASSGSVVGLLAVTAKVNGLTLATRNVGDIERTGVDFFDPFAASPA